MSANTSVKTVTETGPGIAKSNKPCVLVIDDSRIIRVSLTRILKKEFEIIEASDGEEGWQALVKNPSIQVVVTDADMPVLDGYELITRIRQSDQPQLSNIPVIMITGAEDDHIREKALKTGATDFIVKPPDKTQLLARVRANAKADTTSRKLSEESTTDALTKVSSKRFFLQRGEQDLAFAKRHAKDMSVVTLVLDDFKSLMKQQGTGKAKEVLIKTAELLKYTARTEDTVARVGDYAFAILIPNASQLEAATLCVRAKALISSAKFKQQDDSEFSITTSIGLTCLSQDQHQSIQQFLDSSVKRATQAFREGGDKLVAWQADQTPAPETQTKPETPAPQPEITNVNEALNAIENKSAVPATSLKGLVVKILPILELANKILHWDIDEHLNAIKNKLSK